MAVAKQCLQASAIAFYLLGHFYASYRQLTISTNNSLPLRGYHVSHPPLRRYLLLWLSLQHMICVCLRANEKSKKDMTLQSTIVSRKAGGCMAF